MMKHWTRKFAILLMALTVVCAMSITAAAADVTWTNGEWTVAGEHTGEGHSQTISTTAPTCKVAGTRTVTCECGATRTDTAEKLTTHTYGAWTVTDDTHSRTCSVCGAVDTGAHAFGDWTDVAGTDNHKKTCADCGKTVTEAHTYPDTWTSNGTLNHKKECTACGDLKTGAHSWKAGSKWEADGANHKRECADCGWVVDEHVYGNWTKVDNDEHKHVCNTCRAEEKAAHTLEYTPNAGGTTHKKVCTECGATIVASENHVYDQAGDACVCGAKDPKCGEMLLVGSPLEANQNVGSSDGRRFSVTHSIIAGTNDVTTQFNTPTYEWNLTKDGETTKVSTAAAFALPSGIAVGDYVLTCKVTAALKTDATFKVENTLVWSITVKNMKSVAVTIPENIGSFSFIEQSPQDGRTIYEQIVSSLNLPSGSHVSDCFIAITPSVSGAGYLTGSTSAYLTELDEISFTPAGTGTWTANYVVNCGMTEVLSGTITITVAPYTNIDILYSATIGESVKLNVSDFQEFWAESTNNRGYLERVRITGVTGVSGSLCYGHKSSETFHTTANGNDFYVSPSYTQKTLSDLTFVPAKMGNTYRTGSVTISFIAYGTTTQGYTSGSKAGSIVITYTNGAVQPISYQVSGGYIVLDSADFNSVYRAATGTTSNTVNYTVKFLDLPRYGTLYRNYTGTSFTANRAVALTKNNINTLTFNNYANSDSALSRVAYVPAYQSGMADTVRYGVYSGNSLLYVGTINFQYDDLTVEYNSYAAGVTFNSYDFYFGSASMLNAQYITFGTPSSGTLYKNYSAGKGTAVTPYDYFSYYDASGADTISNLTFVPKAGFTGVVEIPFYTGSQYSGTAAGVVRIYVVAKPFSDVNASSWSAPYINRLYASGIVSGTTTTTFSPNANMKYGEALKMILLAAGYQKQTETTGANWAQNYLKLAYNKGIVSTMNIDLNAVITRDAVAEIAAKALGLGKASSINAGITAPVDSTNGYVYALYNAGIVGGDSSTGTNHFYGNRGITRAEVAKIICNISDFDK